MCVYTHVCIDYMHTHIHVIFKERYFRNTALQEIRSTEHGVE